MKKNYPKGLLTNIVVQEVENEVLIYNLTTEKVNCLNETSAFIWQMCDGKTSVAKINKAVSDKFNSTVSEGYIWLALDQLKKENLIEGELPPPTELKDLTRREIIRKIGIGSMIALPIISSLTAPVAIHAASSCFPNCLCSMDGGAVGAICGTMTGMVGQCPGTASCDTCRQNNLNGAMGEPGTCFTA